MGLTDLTNPSMPSPPSGPPAGIVAPGTPSVPATQGPDPALDLLIDYNARFATTDPARFRDDVIEATMAVLIGASKPNALLVGPAGVGKTRIVEDIARRIATHDPLVPPALAGSTVYELPASNIVAGSGIVGQIEEKTKAIIEFASDPGNHAILFIDEIHQLVSGGEQGPYGRVSQILKPALARGDLHVIGATTAQEARGLDADPAFKRRFCRLVVDELSVDQTLEVLRSTLGSLGRHYRGEVSVADDMLAETVRVADRELAGNLHRPDSALTLLDRAMAFRLLEHRRLINEANARGDKATAAALSRVGAVPLTSTSLHTTAISMTSGGASVPVLDAAALHDDLTGHLVGQDDVLDPLVDRLERERLALFPRTTPIAWMFAGASGVGKTAAARIIARRITGSDPIILNMSEYAHDDTVNRLIGSPPGYIGSESNTELPLDALASDPYRVVLLDEFEKAARPVQRLFLQALDSGTMSTNRGTVIDFSRALIIATTNAARESLSGVPVGFGGTGESGGTVSTASLAQQLSRVFDPELLGRFSASVGFHPITRDIYRDVLAAHYTEERSRIIAERPSLARVLPDRIGADDIEALTTSTFIADQGARPAIRAVRAWIEDRVLAPRRTAPAITGADPSLQKEFS